MASDSTQHLIDLAAKFTDGKATVATVAELGDRMLAAGASAEELTAVTKRVALAFEESSAAVKSTSDAVGVGEAKYGELETAAERAAKSVEKLGVQIDAQRQKLQAASEAGNDKGTDRAAAKLRQLVERQGEAVAKSDAAAAALRVEAAALDAVRTKADAASKTHEALGKGLKNVESAATKAAEAEKKAGGSHKASEVAAGLAKLGGPLGVAGQKAFSMASGFEKLGASLGSAGGYVAIAVGIVAIASAAGLATYAITSWAVSMADANRTQSLMAAGVARSVTGGVELEKTIARLGGVVPQTREELLAMAGGLANAGYRGKDLANALENAAVEAAQLKFGPAFQKQMLALPVQAKRLQVNLADTFGGLKIEGLLEGIQTLVKLFDSTTESGKALKFLFEALFQPIVDGAAGAATKVERFFLYGELLALNAYIALKPYRSEIEAVGKAFLIGAAIIVGLFVGAVLAAIAVVALAVALVGALAAALYELGALIVGAVVGAFEKIKEEVLHFADLGGQMIDGLINGITSKASAVADALTSVVSDGVKSVEKFLHLGSPSKLLFGMGEDTGAGFTGGVQATSDDAQSALLDLVAPPSATKGAGAGASSSGTVVQISITVEGRGESDDGIANKIADKLRELFESGALMLGGGEVPGGA